MNLRANQTTFQYDSLALWLIGGAVVYFVLLGETSEILLSIAIFLLAGRHWLNDWQSLLRPPRQVLALRSTRSILLYDGLLCLILVYCTFSFAAHDAQLSTAIIALSALILAFRHVLNDCESRNIFGSKGTRHHLF
ncbi:hypothetical protein [Chitinibacter sp. S2-10]|uniref:hypothetical protein n=1 Tax=Chitinibacter sp. S2-10 TaxID=3373597 RepID=UPI003977378E